MELIATTLHASAPIDPFGGSSMRARAFVLGRAAGNVALYTASALAPELGAVRTLGGLDRQYLNHAHEASPAAAQVREAFGAPLHVHAADAAETAETVSVDATFTDRHAVGDDLEVIPVPGHTPGATAFLWRGPDGRVLFTGDTLYVRDGEWVAALLDGISDRDDYVSSLTLLAGLEFDVLAPAFSSAGAPAVFPSDRADARRRIGEVADSLRAGGNR